MAIFMAPAIPNKNCQLVGLVSHIIPILTPLTVWISTIKTIICDNIRIQWIYIVFLILFFFFFFFFFFFKMNQIKSNNIRIRYIQTVDTLLGEVISSAYFPKTSTTFSSSLPTDCMWLYPKTKQRKWINSCLWCSSWWCVFVLLDVLLFLCCCRFVFLNSIYLGCVLNNSIITQKLMNSLLYTYEI